jgi:excisionase family DNA binding protein
MTTVTETSPNDLLTVEEAAALLRCSTKHVRRQIKGGTMPGLVRIGMRVYRINRTKLLAGEL